MALEIQDEQRTLTGFRKKTEEITRAIQVVILEGIIHKSKELNIKEVKEDEKKGKGEVTLRLIEQIRRAGEEDVKQLAEIKHESFIEEEVVTISCGVPGFSLEMDRVIAIKAIAGTKRLNERL